jgi:hypothetical protein
MKASAAITAWLRLDMTHPIHELVDPLPLLRGEFMAEVPVIRGVVQLFAVLAPRLETRAPTMELISGPYLRTASAAFSSEA